MPRTTSVGFIVSIIAVACLLIPGCKKSATRTADGPATRPEQKASPFRVVTLTPAAAKAVREIIAQQGFSESACYVRAQVNGGGSTGFKYALDIVQQIDPANDEVGESQGIRIVVDHRSCLYLAGTKIDYRKSAAGEGFAFDNPNAVPVSQP